MDLIPRLERALERFLGKNLRPSPARALGDFGLLPEAHQLQVVQVLRSQLSFVEAAVKAGLDAYNEVSLVRMAMRKLNLLADDNIVQKIQMTDVVEIFSSDHTQIYRSYSCFALCNYSIAELVAYPWYELYERPARVHDRLMELGLPVLNGEKSHQDLEDFVPPYLLKEKMTEERAAFRVQEKLYARMMCGLNRSPYLLSVKSIAPIESGPSSGLAFL